jgi:hypothetical protein
VSPPFGAACSVWSGSCGATPGMPPVPTGAPLRLAQDAWLTSWAFSMDGNPGQGRPPLGTHLGNTYTSPSISLSLSLSHSPSLFSFLPPKVRARQPLQLTMTKWQLDDSALLA